MLVYSLNSTFNFRNPVVTIGTFDGVHTGHMAVLSRLKERAEALNGDPVVITFFPHPRQVVYGSSQPLSLLTTSNEKRELIEKAGVSHLIIIDFDKELSMMEACDFVDKVLVKRIGAKHLIVGFNHHFGWKGEGDFNTIQQCAGRYDLTVEMVDAVISSSGIVSSSFIRDALLEGRIEDANKMLGYSYRIRGRIVEGRKIGRQIGFPTANVKPGEPEKLIPGNGVYAVSMLLGEEEFKGVMSIGVNPTVNRTSSERKIEVNIFSFDKEIYGSEITVFARFRLRDEMVFGSLDELAAQIRNDKMKAIAMLG
ncbi:MAG: bifunctional riboflavin kinase/FAD synthetase [Bacteroidales bacterium]|jgi:riboflavin kinase/FMN adenylyltransferase